MDVNAVAEYLKQNPQFFEDYADMIAEIFVPHPHGGHAIPIAERQIVTLREKNHELESKLRGLQGDQFMAMFVREQVKAGVQLSPPTGPVSPEMRKRPAGIAALVRAFPEFHFDRNDLRSCAFPVFYAYGDLSHEEQAVKAGILARLFPDIRVQRFAGIHHFVPPEMIYTSEYARSLLEHWRRAEQSAR